MIEVRSISDSVKRNSRAVRAGRVEEMLRNVTEWISNRSLDHACMSPIRIVRDSAECPGENTLVYTDGLGCDCVRPMRFSASTAAARYAMSKIAIVYVIAI